MVTDKGTELVGSIRDMRHGLGLSQEALARRAECSTVYIQMLERGYTPKHSDVLPRVLEVLQNEVEPGMGVPGSTETPVQAAGHDTA